MSDIIKQFSWHSDKLAKGKEYHEFNALFVRQLGSKGITYCLSEEDTALYRPVAPANVGTPTDRKKMRQTHQEAMRRFYSHFDSALGVLRLFFKIDTYAASEIDKAAITVPAGVQPQDWTPDRRFRAAYDRIVTTFAPQDSTDVNHLRREIQELTDVSCGGFDEYISEFQRLHLALIKANAPPTITEAREWVMKSVENIHIKTFLASSVLLINPEVTYEQIFTAVRTHLKLLGNFDPYKSMHSSPVNKPTAAAMVTNEKTRLTRLHPIDTPRCTRCWRQGHLWKKCTAYKCSVCNQPFNGSKFCTNYMNHAEAGTKWVAPHLLNSMGGQVNTPPTLNNNNDTPGNSVTPSPNQSFKAAKRALRVAYQNLHEAKKQRKFVADT